MNILIVGFYGVMNAGDDLLQQSLAWALRDHHLTYSRVMPHQDAIHQYDLLVVGGGSIWPNFTFFQFADEYSKSLRIPYMVVGISAKQFNADIARKTKLLIDNSLLFHVRDKQTAQWLDHPRVHLGPDLFWMAPWSGDLEAGSIPNDGVALAPRSSALAQWPMADMVNALSALGPVHGWPFYYGAAQYNRGDINDYEMLAADLKGVPPSFSIHPLRSSRYVFTMRYHGLLCGLRAGRPVMVGRVESKLANFCMDNGLDTWLFDSIGALKEQAMAIRDNFEQEYQKALDLRIGMLEQGAALAQIIRDRVATLKPRTFSATRKLLINGLRNTLTRIS